jgi:hypothetical protein
MTGLPVTLDMALSFKGTFLLCTIGAPVAKLLITPPFASGAATEDPKGSNLLQERLGATDAGAKVEVVTKGVTVEAVARGSTEDLKGRKFLQEENFPNPFIDLLLIKEYPKAPTPMRPRRPSPPIPIGPIILE